MATSAQTNDQRQARHWRAPSWITLLFGLSALVFVPWTVLLVSALPSAHRSEHWDVAWAGFDVALALLLLAVAWAAWRGSAWLEGAAAAAAALLVVDAWFDILTASGRSELLVAILEAAFVELPLAVICILLARKAEREVVAARPAAGSAEPEVGSRLAEL